jgi:hypothetical protein
MVMNREKNVRDLGYILRDFEVGQHPSQGLVKRIHERGGKDTLCPNKTAGSEWDYAYKYSVSRYVGAEGVLRGLEDIRLADK